ncbi:MAG TPA: acyltransferase [Chthoniobacteraceae bacterium]|nr:acyltransferase [Chthoniobacteraceae bacterium]
MKRNGQFENLTFLRALAIVMVLGIHSVAFLPNSFPKHFALSFIIGGFFGVPIFFALSGFLIARPFFKDYQAGEKVSIKAYIAKRAAKIIPPFFLSLCLASAIQIHAQPEGWAATLSQALKIFLFLHPFLVVFTKLDGNVYWSLAPEVYYYILFPLFFLLSQSKGLFKNRLGLCLPSALLLLISLLCFAGSLGSGAYPLELGTYFVFFSIGSFAALTSTYWPSLMAPLRRFDGIAFVALFAAAFYFGWYSSVKIPVSGIRFYALRWIAAAALFPLLLPATEQQTSWLNYLGRLRLVRMTAMISYEWYLFHIPIVLYFHSGLDVTNGNLLEFLYKCVLPIPLSWCLAFLIHRYYSLPLHASIVKHFSQERHGAAL